MKGWREWRGGVAKFVIHEKWGKWQHSTNRCSSLLQQLLHVCKTGNLSPENWGKNLQMCLCLPWFWPWMYGGLFRFEKGTNKREIIKCCLFSRHKLQKLIMLMSTFSCFPVKKSVKAEKYQDPWLTLSSVDLSIVHMGPVEDTFFFCPTFRAPHYVIVELSLHHDHSVFSLSICSCSVFFALSGCVDPANFLKSNKLLFE